MFFPPLWNEAFVMKQLYVGHRRSSSTAGADIIKRMYAVVSKSSRDNYVSQRYQHLEMLWGNQVAVAAV